MGGEVSDFLNFYRLIVDLGAMCFACVVVVGGEHEAPAWELFFLDSPS
jgi:hypothetical protein